MNSPNKLSRTRCLYKITTNVSHRPKGPCQGRQLTSIGFFFSYDPFESEITNELNLRVKLVYALKTLFKYLLTLIIEDNRGAEHKSV